MQNYINGLRDGVNRLGNVEGNNAIQRQYLDRAPNPRNILFTFPEQQLEILYATLAIARARVRQQVYHTEQPPIPCPQPPLWDEEARTMMVLWIARDRRLFEWEMREMEYLLGLRGTR
ncbi:hypothetical protein CY34DRAFT_17046 [Suillus luteus UH-Slu-Lm8-n1]|uniref:Uncharacterized protein n=1 Tax=Suillus luteus UH-Slu-Lm8-n1 TaxID=930992 RepID=A0A0D0AMF8_9AGAM|nr:hypothetical protein CY34DRAFT_17046 [Suillus luteus UH-Slu-Lm8-n1]